jgi:hypothetical protein
VIEGTVLGRGLVGFEEIDFTAGYGRSGHIIARSGRGAKVQVDMPHRDSGFIRGRKLSEQGSGRPSKSKQIRQPGWRLYATTLTA